ncbi:hypothetical protein COLO4_10219 [Corchorus olitorius]|uniref:Uncharacterized protein n=1 Tax=Corchorus olitorius TaxID=93759 RepID=A0A1R3K9M3_9ROSI|nr:hypothetical protein COLO4_10219 [Corchorus olitorius]
MENSTKRELLEVATTEVYISHQSPKEISIEAKGNVKISVESGKKQG